MQKVFYGIGALLVLALLIGLMLPRHSRFVLSAEIDAPPTTVFALVNDMRRTRLWSHTAEIDPNAEYAFSGPARGAGSTVAWDGPVAGSGTQTIVESRAAEFVETRINAGEPGEARTWFELEPANGGTLLRWGFSHDYGFNLIGRYAGLVVTGIIRRDYERGLAGLEDLAESLPSADFSDLRVERIQIESKPIAYKSMQSAPDAASMSLALGAAYSDILNFIDAHELRAAGSPLSIARDFSGARLNFDAGIPVAGVGDETPREADGVRLGRTDGGTVLRITHKGPYRRLSETHRKVTAYLAAHGIERDGDSWESYVSDPAEVPEANLLTYIYYPIRDES